MRRLLGKDLKILARSRLLVSLLVVYPVAIALLIGFAISASPSKPKVAVVDETPPGETITLGGRRVGLDEYTNELFDHVQVVRVPTRAQAVAKVASGDVLAAIVIPPDIVSKISSGVSQAHAEVIYNGDALKQSFVRSAIDSALAQANLALSQQIKSVAVHDLNLLLSGGKIGPLGSQELIGLRQLPATLKGIAARQPHGQDRATLTRIAGFAEPCREQLGSRRRRAHDGQPADRGSQHAAARQTHAARHLRGRGRGEHLVDVHLRAACRRRDRARARRACAVAAAQALARALAVG